MKLSRTSWHRKFYKSAYQQTPSRSFCQYFWKLILAIILLPFTWPSHLANVFKAEIPQAFGIVVSVFALCCGAGYQDVTKETSNIISYGMGWVVFVILFSVVIGACCAMSYIKDRLEDRAWKKSCKPKAPKQPSLIKTAWKAFLEKNCPIITWED